ncbi:alpha/beta hydrolase [Streptomyces sp. NPDC005438]|uniref:alpha/beta fold hydrolase n=1 Tax=Streptomyces sp. NPDC005438 TaxID=3156880 RepID=UPI0033B1CF1E
MPVQRINGIDLAYQDDGQGEPVVLVMGSGAEGRVWRAHQTPALRAAGYRTVTFDNRGIPPTDCSGGFTVDDLVADTVGLIEYLGLERCRLVGTSMGAHVVQELCLARPDLVHQAVFMATRGRTDAMREEASLAERQLLDSGVRLPPRYAATVQAMQFLSPRTLDDDRGIRDWLDILELSADAAHTPGYRAQLELDVMPDRLADYGSITAPCLVVGFADDLVLPPHLSREVAEAVPGARYVEIPDAGHFGYLEQPELVNKELLSFFQSGTSV